MRRRILAAVVGTVAAALVLAGLGTLVLDRVSARRDAERELRALAEGVVQIPGIAPATDPGAGGAVRRAQALRLLRGLRLDGIDYVAVTAKDRVLGRLPDGVGGGDVDRAALRAGQTVSGRHGRLVYAMAPQVGPRGAVLVAVLTRQVKGAPPAAGWFLLAAGLTLVLAVVVGVALSRAVTAPLRRAEAATQRIAAGDLTVRVPEPGTGGRSDELRDLTRSINAMAEALERSQGLERQFLLSISHDLRTPLTSIRGWAEAIEDGTAPDARTAAAVVLSEARRLERLVRDLLDLARLQSRRFTFEPRPVAVGELVALAAEGLRPEAEDAGVALAVSGDGGTRAVADPDRLAQIVANLVENGLRFAATAVWVSTLVEPATVAVTVTDDGPGIAAEDLPYVFERLYVARSRPVRKESGSGLGLAIVRELVTAMGGTVHAESPVLGGPGSDRPEREPGGTRIVVRLPRSG
ncbi:MAG: HAMP domain-containing histidine kinase [Actinobacteria bacterium]|nr:HAMP domain-containing histidine kinase [Actinomycetota bacterium]